MNRLAIVGAGASGLAAAWALRAAGLDVVVFEKSRGFSGRAATRRWEGGCYDFGANYFKLETPSVRALVREHLPTEDLVQVEGDVWTFDVEGICTPGNMAANTVKKWTYRRGINTLGKLLAAQATAEVQRRTQVARMMQQARGWTLYDTADRGLGTFDGVVLTPPAPQTVGILRESRLDASLQRTLIDGLKQALYAAQFAVVLGFGRVLARPAPSCYALLNTDRKHDVAWMSFEDDKPGHVPAGQSVLIIQMAPHWTEAHFAAAPEQVVRAAARRAGTVLEASLAEYAWYDVQRWRYALPTTVADAEALAEAAGAGLFVTGDATVGEGGVGKALAAGLQCAARILAAMD